MSLGLSDHKAAKRRRWRLIRWLFTLAFVAVLGAASYRGGSELARREVSRLQQEVGALTTDIAALREENVQLQEQAEAARLSEAQWQKRFEAEVPTGKSRELLALIEAQTEKGADPARIEFLVGAAANERSCEDLPKTKRFLVRTPLYEGANDAVTFGDNAIVVTAQGESATDADGNPEAWFDPAKPVTLSFIGLGGGGSEVSGVLPLHHSVVRGDKEYRFSIVAAERQGFVSATEERCAYP